MKYSERKQLMENLDPAQLNGGKTPMNIAEGHYRWYVIQLLADIADNVGSMAYAYGEMLKIQQAKSNPPRPAQQPNATPHRMEGIPPTEQSRYGGPK